MPLSSQPGARQDAACPSGLPASSSRMDTRDGSLELLCELSGRRGQWVVAGFPQRLVPLSLLSYQLFQADVAKNGNLAL